MIVSSQKNYLELYHTLAKGCDGNDKKLRRKFNCRAGKLPTIKFLGPDDVVEELEAKAKSV